MEHRYSQEAQSRQQAGGKPGLAPGGVLGGVSVIVGLSSWLSGLEGSYPKTSIYSQHGAAAPHGAGAGIEGILILPHKSSDFPKEGRNPEGVCPAGSSSVWELGNQLPDQVALPCLPQLLGSTHLANSGIPPF